MPLCRHCDCRAHVVLVRYAVYFVYVHFEVVGIVVREWGFVVAGVHRVAVRNAEPRRGAVQLDALCELVVLERPFQLRVFGQYGAEVRGVVGRRAVLAALEQRHYAVCAVRLWLCSLLRGRRQRGDAAAQAQHGEVRGHGCQLCPRLCLRVEAAVAVQPDQVESVQQPSVSRVGGMVGVCPLAVIDDHAVRCACPRVRPPAAVAALVHVRQELLDSLADRVVQAAEVADRAALLQRVAGLARERLHRGDGACRLPLCRLAVHAVRQCRLCALCWAVSVRPRRFCGVCVRHAVGVCVVLRRVARVCRPVEQVHHVIARRVNVLVPAEFIDQRPRRLGVPVGRHSLGQRHDHADTRLLLGVRVRRVYHALRAAALQVIEQLVGVEAAAVQVERHQRARQRVCLLAYAVLERAADEAAHVLGA